MTAADALRCAPASARRREIAERVIAGLYPGASVRWMPDESGASWIVDVTLDGVSIGHPVWCRLLRLGLPLLPWTSAATVRTMARAELVSLRKGSVMARCSRGGVAVLADGRVSVRGTVGA